MSVALAMIEIEGLSQWMWPARADWVGGFPPNPSEPLIFSLDVPEKISVSLDDETTLQFQFDLDGQLGHDGFSATKRIQVWIVPNSSMGTFDYSLNIIHRLREFMSFVADADLAIHRATHWQQNFFHLTGQDKVEAFKKGNEFYGLADHRGHTAKEYDFLFEFDMYQDRFADIIRRWMRIYDKNEFAMQSWFGNVMEERTVKYNDLKFMAAVTAVEALCRANHSELIKSERGRKQKSKFKKFKLAKQIEYEMCQLGHFQDEQYASQLAQMIVQIRNKIVHQSGFNPFRNDIDPSNFARLEYCTHGLFKLMILSKLSFDSAERSGIIRSTQNLNNFLRFPDLDVPDQRDKET